jgi:branched-chain amino acid transport system permease protein
MTKFVELLISGVSLGFIYALISMGFVVIFKATEVVNFAHGSVLLFGGFIVATLQDGLGFLPAVLSGVAAAGVLAVAVEFLLIRRIRRANHNVLAILTLGVDIVLIAELTRQIGPDVLSTGDPWRDEVARVGAFGIAQTRLAAIVVALLLIATFFALFKHSKWGVATRAAAEDSEAAALMGIRLGRVSAGAWLVAGGLAAVAGVFLAGFPSPGLTPASGHAAIKAFPAAILGGLDSTGGAVVGGVIVGIAEALTAGYQDNLLFFGRGIGDVTPFVLMILVLLWRPSGLFGTRAVSRV